jgi:hypothetical protein
LPEYITSEVKRTSAKQPTRSNSNANNNNQAPAETNQSANSTEVKEDQNQKASEKTPLITEKKA